MYTRAIILSAALFFLPAVHAEELPREITRIEAFQMIWTPLKRPIEKTYEQPFNDVNESHPNFSLITYAKARGIVDDGRLFFPNDPKEKPPIPLKDIDVSRRTQTDLSDQCESDVQYIWWIEQDIDSSVHLSVPRVR